jgi:hypothetical protein
MYSLEMYNHASKIEPPGLIWLGDIYPHISYEVGGPIWETIIIRLIRRILTFKPFIPRYDIIKACG